MLFIPYYYVVHVLFPREMQRSKENQENINIDKTVNFRVWDGRQSKVVLQLSTACRMFILILEKDGRKLCYTFRPLRQAVER